ncbi:MAG: FAD-dependent oxidoreductase [Haloferacaceae archaeon]
MDAVVTVTAVETVGPDTVAIEVETPEGFEAAPGQFVRLGATVDGTEYARFYTISSADVAGTVEVTVGVDEAEGGPFSAHLAALAPGDRLTMSGPFGDQYYRGESRVVVLAGGPGVGAAVGIGERALADGASVAVVYRDDGAPVHRDRLAALREAGADVTVTDGPIDDAVAAALAGTPGEQVFVYGFEAFVEEARRALADAGADPADAKVESFG